MLLESLISNINTKHILLNRIVFPKHQNRRNLGIKGVEMKLEKEKLKRKRKNPVLINDRKMIKLVQLSLISSSFYNIYLKIGIRKEELPFIDVTCDSCCVINLGNAGLIADSLTVA